jgi:UDP-N-acetylglucosamine 2-epimerase (non-hydrolysing)
MSIARSLGPRRLVAVIAGTRPEAVKVAPVIRKLADSPVLAPLVVSTSQHREMTQQIFDDFGISVDVDLDVMRPRQNLWDLTARVSSKMGAFFEGNPVSAVLVQGDTTSAFVGAMSAFYHQIPVGHIEAGLRSHDRYSPFPEEMNRMLLGCVAGWHFAPTPYAARQLRRENVSADDIFMTGNTVVDALHWMVQRVSDEVLPAAARNKDRRLVLVTCHRRENLGKPMVEVAGAVRDLADKHEDLHFLFPVHPNPAVRDAVYPVLSGHPQITLCEPLGYDEFLAALKRAWLVLSDSGGVQEESTALGKPVLVLRKETERPEGVKAGTLKLVGTDRARIVDEVERLSSSRAAYAKMTKGSKVFGDGKAAERIVSVLEEKLQPSGARRKSAKASRTSSWSKEKTGSPPMAPAKGGVRV